MNKLSKMKIVLIIIMSLSLILALTNWVYAVDDDPFISMENNTSSANALDDDDFEPLPATNINSNANNTNVENTNKVNELITNSNTINNVSNVANTNNTNVNRNVSNTDTLAKTGLADSKGFVAFVVVLCAISAVYSLKKISDYKKI